MSVSASAGQSFDFEKLKGRSNLDQTPVGVSGQWTLEKLLALTQDELMYFWSDLPAVPANELNGHYMGLVPRANDPELQKSLAHIWDEHSELGGYWLGKAFRPLTETTGEGHNRFRMPGGKIAHKHWFRTYIGDSLIDGKPAYLLDYRTTKPDVSADEFRKNVAVDEFRKLEEFLYLVAATSDDGSGGRTKPIVFVMIGPTDRWVGPTDN